jgi:hypothetical protein
LIPPDRTTLNAPSKVSNAHELWDETHRTEIDGTHDIVSVVRCRDDDDRQRRISLAKLG